MEIGTESVARLYGGALQATKPDGAPQPGVDDAPEPVGFVDAAAEVAQETLNTVKDGEQTTLAMMSGKADAHSVIEALAATEMALEMAVTVRDKVVEAYQEILRMPV